MKLPVGSVADKAAEWQQVKSEVVKQARALLAGTGDLETLRAVLLAEESARKEFECDFVRWQAEQRDLRVQCPSGLWTAPHSQRDT